jgi:hypothetical protein
MKNLLVAYLPCPLRQYRYLIQLLKQHGRKLQLHPLAICPGAV